MRLWPFSAPTSTARTATNKPSTELPSVYLEHRGQDRIESISQSVRKVPWLISFLELVWTAGPVTFIAAVGGYYFGYGKVPPVNYLIFFLTYSIIAGLISIVTRLTHTALRNTRQEKAQNDLTQVLDLLPDLIFAVRDLHLQTLDADQRRREAAALLLRKADLGPEYIAVAVRELTDNSALAEAIKRIEIFRRAGLYHRVEEISASIGQTADAVLSELNKTAPEKAALLRDRLTGRAPTLQAGITRTDGFIERILAASAEGNEDLILLADIENLLVFAFEMLCGRKIPMLVFTYRGDWRLAKATDELERRRNQYRVSQLRVHSRLKATVTLLAECQETTIDSPQAGTSPQELVTSIKQGLEQLNAALAHTGQAVYKGYWHERSTLRRQIDVLRAALKLCRSLHRAHQQVRRRHLVFLESRRRWETMVNNKKRHANTLIGNRQKPGLRINREHIVLQDTQKLAMAETLAEYFQDMGIKLRDQRIVFGSNGRERLFSLALAKPLAMRVTSALSFHLGLSDPQVQRAINASNAINLSGLEPASSATAKAGLGTALAQEIEDRLDRLAEQLATTLVISYGIKLDDQAVQFLHEEFGARLERLQTLASRSLSLEQTTATHYPISPPLELNLQEITEAPQRRSHHLIERYETLLQRQR